MLKDRVALVTGSTSGIGLAIARAFAKEGANVVINGFGDAAAIEQERAGIESEFGVKALYSGADMTKGAEIAAMVADAQKALGSVDILVNNAGLQRDSAFAEMSLASWNTVIGVNLTGQFLCAREAVREFLRRGVVPSVSKAAGKIICMSSVHQMIPWAGHANYAASKGGLKMMMETLAQEVAPQRIRVNGIAPGAVRTPINTAAWNTPEAYRQLMTLVPYKRIGEPEDIGKAAVWLASDDSDYVVGATLFVDGGMTLFPDFAEGG